MKTLIVDDEFTNRKLLQALLSTYGECDIAVNGKEALEAFALAWEANNPYDLICLDIMMPEMNGQEVLKKIRTVEAEKGIHGLKGVKVVMTTALDDHENILKAFKAQCEAYLVKPIDRDKLIEKIKEFKLI